MQTHLQILLILESPWHRAPAPPFLSACGPRPRDMPASQPTLTRLGPAHAHFLPGHSGQTTNLWRPPCQELFVIILLGGEEKRKQVSACALGIFLCCNCYSVQHPTLPSELQKREVQTLWVFRVWVFWSKMFSGSESISFWVVRSGDIFWFHVIKLGSPSCCSWMLWPGGTEGGGTEHGGACVSPSVGEPPSLYDQNAAPHLAHCTCKCNICSLDNLLNMLCHSEGKPFYNLVFCFSVHLNLLDRHFLHI